MKALARPEIVPGITVTAAASRLGLTTRQVRRLAALGMPHEWRFHRRRILWPDAEQWYAAHLVEAALAVAEARRRPRRARVPWERRQRIEAFVASLPKATVLELLYGPKRARAGSGKALSSSLKPNDQ